MASRIISLNLHHGGGPKISRLADWLVSKSPSTIVATEWRNNDPGQYLKDRLALDGLESIAATPAASQKNTVLMAASVLTKSEVVTPPNSPAGDLVLMTLPGGLTILGCYFPQLMAKSQFFHRCVEMAERNSHLPFLMIGDFNTGRNDLDIEGNGTPFHCADLFEGLQNRVGMVDLWRAQHGKRQDWTWRSAKNGFRIDHAFGNEAFIERFPKFRCEIDHEPRLTKITDHSAIILDPE